MLLTVLIPARNEESYIGKCLDSVLANTLSEDSYEIIVMDGNSEDHTKEIVRKYMERYRHIRMIDNKDMIVSKSMNLGISEARGQYVIRLDAHATYNNCYLEQSMEPLKSKHIIGVGGLMEPVGDSVVGNAVARSMKSRFSSGGAAYRHASEAIIGVDTIWCGCWRKVDLVKVGGFNEQWVRNQDYELNIRLRKHGQLMINPAARAKYFVRNSFPRLSRQYFNYGFWRLNTMVRHPRSIKARHIIPPLFFLFITFVLVFRPIFGMILIGSLFFAVLAVIFFDTKSGGPQSLNDAVLVVIAIVIMQLSWVSGLFYGAAKKLKQKTARWLF